MSTSSPNVKIETAAVDPQAAAKEKASILGAEQAPTFSEQSGAFTDWQRIRDNLGQPYDVESIPLRKLRQMRRDPMVGFGLHYTKVPLVRARWHVDARDKNGPNAQVAAFMDAAWRKIHARYIFQRTIAFDFGFSAMAKRFILENPGGYYIDPTVTDANSQLKPVWDQGNVLPLTWKSFVALPPERVEPLFDDVTGEFTGISETLPTSTTGGSKSRRKGGAGNQNSQKNTREIDIYHALWGTNEKDSAFGSIYGWPLIAMAYRYWWSYWFRWAMADRAFERQAIPPLVAYHPVGLYRDDNGETLPYWQVALEAAEQLRANSIAAVPSTLASTASLDGTSSSLREWEFRFLEPTGENLKDLDTSFNYLDVMKLRSIFVPEQSLIEGQGGQSSRNVAEQFNDVAFESQGMRWDEIADEINRLIFPQILLQNFPDFVANGGTAKIVGQGFASEDVEFLKQVIQLIGQNDATLLGVDIREALSRLGMPLLTPAQQQEQRNQIITNQSNSQPPVVNGNRSSVGTTTIAGVNQGGTNGGSVPNNTNGAASITGFEDRVVYIQPNEVIVLSDDADFLTGLPSSKHYTDKAMKALTVQLKRTWHAYLSELYPDFADYVGDQKISLEDEEVPNVFLAMVPKKKAQQVAKRIIKKFGLNEERAKQVIERSRVAMTSIMRRMAELESKKLGVEPYRLPAGKVDEFIGTQVEKLIKSVHSTVQADLTDHLTRHIIDGNPASDIGTSIKSHFAEFPQWKSAGIARDTVRDAANAATLLTSEGLNYKHVRAVDGTTHDARCKNRNGKLLSLTQAWREMGWDRTHPNDVLAFEIIPRANLSIQFVDKLPDGHAVNAVGVWVNEEGTVYLRDDVSDTDADNYLKVLAAVLADEEPERLEEAVAV